MLLYKVSSKHLRESHSHIILLIQYGPYKIFLGLLAASMAPSNGFQARSAEQAPDDELFGFLTNNWSQQAYRRSGPPRRLLLPSVF